MVERLAGFEQEPKRAPRFAMRGVLAALRRPVRPLMLKRLLQLARRSVPRIHPQKHSKLTPQSMRNSGPTSCIEPRLEPVSYAKVTISGLASRC